MRDLVVLDESGANLAMAREYGRALGGQRLHCPKPYHRGHKFSMISAISIENIVASLYIENSFDGDTFTGFVEQCLAPKLKPRHKVIMDNVSFHKVKAAEALIRATGAEIIYLPPYSPDLSPIEFMWSKIKALLKKQAARTKVTFFEAIQFAFHSVNEQDLKNWFKHCGY